MAPNEVDLTIKSGSDLKNVNWRYGDLQPYVVAWIDPAAKSSTRVAAPGGDDDDPVWDEKLVIPVPPGLHLDDATLYLDVAHAGAAEGVKPLVGSARLPLREVLDEYSIGEVAVMKLKLKRPSGRPHGKLEIVVCVKEPAYRYADAPPPGQYGYSRAPYGQPSYAPPHYGQQEQPYAQPHYGQQEQPYAQPTMGYPSGGQPAGGYDYGAPPPAYGYGGEKKSGMGMGTGIAVGAAAGLIGGLALAEGADYVEDKIADDVAERVEEEEEEEGEFDGE